MGRNGVIYLSNLIQDSADGSVFVCNFPLFRILIVSAWEARCIVGFLFFDGKIMCNPELH